MRKKIIRAFVAVVLCLALIIINNTKSRDIKAINKDQVEDAQAQVQQTKDKIAGLNNQLAQLSNDISSVESLVSALDSTLADITSNISYYKGLIAAKQTEIDNKNAEINDKQAEIDKTEIELSEAAASEKKQYEDMKKRIQYMYEQGEESFLEMIFSSGNLSEMLGRAEYAASIAEYDRKQLDRLRATKTYISELLNQLQTDKEELEVEKKNLETQKNDLIALEKDLESQKALANDALATKQATLEKLESEQEYAEIQKKYAEAKLAAQEAEAKRLQEQWAAEVAAAAAAGTNADEANRKKLEEIGLSGGFLWPLPGYTMITSQFGPRTHPITGVYSNHSGVDISGGGVFGAPIVACYSGTVTSVDFYKGDMYAQPYGTSVQVNHGAGVVTLYAHMSGVNVSVGQVVNAGDVLGFVGSTGQSTGAHLHWTLYIKGNLADPLSYCKTIG